MHIQEEGLLMEQCTQKHLNLMKDLENGADVMGLSDALLCRELEKTGHIMITKRQGVYLPKERLPYFGAILTAHGRKTLKETL